MFDPREPYNDLPPVSSIYLELTPELDHLREEARVSIELLNYALKSLPNSEILLDTLALQEAKVSSNIENIRTTNDDLLRAVAFKDFNAETRAISNYKDALLEGFRLLGEKGQFGIEDLEAINAPVNTQGRGVRSNLSNFNTLTRIKRTNDNEDEIIYTPPHGKALLTEQLLDMLNYIYDDEQYDEHPLIKIALAHCQFENIHPFNDGNGRTGRILNILFLCQKGYLSEPILYASSYISGVEWIGEIPTHWNTMRLRSKFSFGKGLPITKADLRDSGVSVVSYGQIHSKHNIGTTIKTELIRYVDNVYLDTNASSLVNNGDFIFADTSEDLSGCGNCVYVDTNYPLFAGYHTMILRPIENTSSKYYSYLFATDAWRSQIRAQASGVKLFSITQKMLRDALLIEPSEEEKASIVSFLDDMCSTTNTIIASNEATIEKLKEYRQSVIYEAVTGKVEVK